MYYVYVLKSLKNGKYYIGVSKDVNRRFEEHNAGYSKSTRCNIPYKLIYKEQFGRIGDAYKREKYLKSIKKRLFLEKIINYSSG